MGCGGTLLLGVLLTLWLPNVSRTGSRVEGCAQGCAASLARHEGPLRVMSLNVLHGFPRFEHLEQRMELIAAEIRRHDADIVLLQEVPWTPQLGLGADYVAERTGMNHLYLRANGNRRAILFEEGEAILSRYPLRNPVSVELEPRAGRFEQRVALGATVATPWGELPVYTTHLTNGATEVNRAQAESLVDFVSESSAGPALVAGDLNAPPGSPQVQSLRSQWFDAGESTAADDSLTCCIGDLTAGPGEILEERIDYLLLVPGQGSTIREYERVLDKPFATEYGWQWASDHVGLLVTIDIEP
jgi:endonuclease/exonuclease/phosphatase family metal-dependent hydrolase